EGGKSMVGRESGQMRLLKHIRIERSISVGGAVVIAEGDERANFKPASAEPGVLTADFVVHGGCIFVLNHEDRLADFDSLNCVGVDRKRSEAKVDQVLISARIDCSAVLIGGKVVTPAVDHQGLFQFRQQDSTADWWGRGGNQQTMIPPRVETGDCRG